MLPVPDDEVRVASFADLGAATLYAVLRLRADVFVVEQQCVYQDLDGRDTEPGTRHLWIAGGAQVRAYLRVLDDGDAQRIGRVVTRRDARGAGLAGRLVGHALGVIGERPAVLAAQAHLTGFYARFGFAVAGPGYLEDGIAHVPMARPAGAQGSAATSSGTERRRPV